MRTREAYRLSAILVNKRTKEPISEARVEAWDADGRCTDLLAFTRADASGHFNLTLSEGAVVGLLADRKPAIELHVFSSEGAPLPDPAWRWQLGAAVTHARVEVDADGTAPTRTPTNCFVRGHVRTHRGAPVAGALVCVSEVFRANGSVAVEPWIATTSNDGRGAFEIAYYASAPTSLVVEVREAPIANGRTLARSPTYCHAPPELTVDLSIDGVFRGASEWEELQATVSPRVVETGTDDTLDLLACRVGVSREQIGHLAAAKRLSSGVSVGEEALYGLLRAGLPSDAARLLRTHPKEVRRRLQRAVDKNHVTAAVGGGGIEATIRRFRAAARTAMLTVDEESPVTTVGGVLRAALPLEDAETFVEEYLAHEGAPEDFWAALPRKKGFERGEVTQRVRFALQAAWLSSPSSLAADAGGSCLVRQSAIPAKKLPAIDPEARFFKPLVVRLLEDRTNGSIRSLKDLARFTDAQFASLVEDVGAPDETPGRSEAARKAHYAEQLKQTLRAAFPTAAIAAAVEAEAPEGHEDLTTFLNDRANEGFAFGETRVATHVAKTTGALARISTRTSSETVENLKAIERAYRLTQDSTQAVRLYKNGIRSAAQVQALGVDGLVEATGVPVESARAIVGRACAISGGAIALQSAVWPSFQGVGASSKFMTGPALKTDLSAPLADWEKLFGSEGSCECEWCHSVLSPAAYLVELLQFLKKMKVTGNTARNVLVSDGTLDLPARRPDIDKIDLSCPNTDKPLPYVDLVNEILEHVTRALCANGSRLDTFPNHLATTGEPRNLLASPEILDSTTRNIAYSHLASWHYPWHLPFHLWLTETRAFASQLGVPFHRLVHALQPGGPPSDRTYLPPPYVFDKERAWERLGLWKQARDVLVGAASGVGANEYWGFSGSGWSSNESLSAARRELAATVLLNGRVLVVGGVGTNGTLDSAELYDPASRTWSPATSMGAARRQFTLTTLANGRVLAAGSTGGGTTLATAEIYDAEANTWTATATMSTARGLHTATLLADGKVLVAFGQDATGALASAEVYDPESGTWTSAPSSDVSRMRHTATRLPDDRVLVLGGMNSAVLSSARIFDPSTNTWTNAADMTTARAAHTAVLLPNGKVLVAGGLDGNAAATESAELYDPATNSWSSAGALKNARFAHTRTILANGKVLVAGGRSSTSSSAALASAELYNPLTNTWSPAESMDGARADHTAALLADGSVLVAGGAHLNAPLAGTALFNRPTHTWASTLLEPATFLEKSGLTYAELRELLDTDFIRSFVPSLEAPNPYLSETGPIATCDLSKMSIKGLSEPEVAWNALHKFLRLRQRLGWTIGEIDYALRTFAPSGSSLSDEQGDELLTNLAIVEHFRAERNVDVAVAASWFGPLDTRRRGVGKKTSFYERLFQNPAVRNPAADVFGLADADGPATPIALENEGRLIVDHASALRSALRLSAHDFALLTDDDTAGRLLGTTARFPASTALMTLANLSSLHAFATLARALRLSIHDLLALMHLSGSEVFTPKTVYLLAQAADRLREGGLKPSDLLFVINGLTTSGSKLVPKDSAITGLIAKLSQALVKVRAAISGASDPKGEQIESILQSLFPDAAAAGHARHLLGGALQVSEETFAANTAATETMAAMTVGGTPITAAVEVYPFISPNGAVTANDADYAAIVFRVHRGGSVAKSWIFTTQTAARGGTGSWVNGQEITREDEAFAWQSGDTITVEDAKTGAGVALPGRSYGFKVVAQKAEEVFVANTAAADEVTANELTGGTISVAGQVFPFITSAGAAVASDTDYASIFFRVERSGVLVNTWVFTTRITGGSGDWTSGACFSKGGDPFACQVGDVIKVSDTKTGAGVVLPERTYGVKVVPATSTVELLANAAARVAVAERDLASGVITAEGIAAPFVTRGGTLTTDDTNFASIVFRVRRGEAVVKTWTFTTRSTGVEDWASSYLTKNDPFRCLAGDRITVEDVKTNAGVELPLRTYGIRVTEQAAAEELAANDLATDTLAERDLTGGIITVPGAFRPFVSSGGVVTADDTHHATITFRVHRSDSGGNDTVVKTWTFTTNATASGGTGSWSDGSCFMAKDPFACLAGDRIKIEETKAGSGVLLPSRAYGLKLSSMGDWFDAHLAPYFAHTDAKTRFLDEHGAERQQSDAMRAYAYGHLRAFVESDKTIAQTLGAELRLAPATALLLAAMIRQSGAPPAQTLLEGSRLARYASEDAAIPEPPPTTLPLGSSAVIALHRAAAIVTKLKLTPAELVKLFWVGDAMGAEDRLIDLNGMVNDSADRLLWFRRWLLTLALWKVRAALPGGPADLLAIFPDSPGDEAASNILGRVATYTGWSTADVLKLAEHFMTQESGGETLITGNPKVPDVALTLTRLHAAMVALNPFQTSAETALAEWLSLGAATDGSASGKIIQAVKARHSTEDWPDVARPLQDTVRSAQRDALVGYILSTGYVKSADELFEWLLIDTETTPAVLTSRIKQALGSVQTFVQRSQLGLEPNMVLNAEQATQWKWMKNYRVWEANRKIFLFPENWVEPALRDDKTAFFKEFESEIRRQEITDETAEDAFIHYLERVKDVANLEVVALHSETNGAVHLVGRTRSTPRKYYYRAGKAPRAGRRVWTPWEPIDIDVESDHFVLMEVNGALALVWGVIEQKPDAEQPKSTDGSEPTRTHLEIGIAMSERRHGRWTAPHTSRSHLSTEGRYHNRTKLGGAINPAEYDLRPEDITLMPFAGAVYGLLNPLRITELSAADDAWPRSDFLVLGRFDIDPCDLNIQAVPLGGFRLISQHDQKSAAAKVPQAQIEALNTQKKSYESYVNKLVEKRNGSDDPSLKKTLATLINQVNEQIDWIDGRIKELGDDASFPIVVTCAEVTKHTRVRCLAGVIESWRFVGQLASTSGPGPIWVFDEGVFSHLLKHVQRPKALREARLVRPNETTSKYLFEEVGWPTSPRTTPLVLDLHEGVYFVERRSEYDVSKGYRATILSHPSVCKQLTTIRGQGVDALLNDRELQLAIDGTLDVIGAPMLKAFDPAMVSFLSDSPSSIYNWELHFHAPLFIAVRLMAARRFDDARKWFERIFDPTQGTPTGANASKPWAKSPYLYWKPSPLFQNKQRDGISEALVALDSGEDSAEKADLLQQIDAWREEPFKPYVIARLRTVTFQKVVVIKYIENLIAWGDELFRRETIEAISEATGLYILARDILGPRPPEVTPTTDPPMRTAGELGDADAFGNSLVETESLYQAPTCGDCVDEPAPKLLTQYFCVPRNEKLDELWNKIADRLFKIRHSMNIDGVFRELALFEPPIDPALLVEAAAAGVDLTTVLNDLSGGRLPYRYPVLHGRAVELAAGVVGLGQSLLAALEKRDGEELALLRSGQEVELLKMQRSARALEVKDAELALAAAKAGKRVIEGRRDHYAALIAAGLLDDEEASMKRAHDAMFISATAALMNSFASAAAYLPDFGAGNAGPFPTTHTKLAGGDKIALATRLGADVLNTSASILQHESTRLATKASQTRRLEDWTFQVQSAQTELAQVDKQIAAAEIRVAITKASLTTHDMQVENAKAVDEHMRSKLTGADLYEWMADRLTELYYEAYKLAFDMAKRAEGAMRAELAVADDEPRFIRFGYWDSARKGLTAGEQLQHALRSLDVAYLERNRRELEITKQFSLLEAFPEALVQLRETGVCEIELREDHFDRDYPGHYLRRVKTVSVTLPAVTGPFSGVSSRLTLLKSRMRKSTSLITDYVDQTSPAAPNDSRFAYDLVPIETVVTSSGQNDAGLFEVVLRDDRFLPFEGAGVISKWRIELPPETNGFDISTLGDLMLHVRYTARDGGAPLRAAVEREVVKAPREGLQRLISVRAEFPEAWQAFTDPDDDEPEQAIELVLGRNQFPYLYGDNDPTATGVRIFAKWDSRGAYEAYAAGPKLAIDVTPPDAEVQAGVMLGELNTMKYGRLASATLDTDTGLSPIGAWKIAAGEARIGLLSDELTTVVEGRTRLNQALRDIFLLITYSQDVG